MAHFNVSKGARSRHESRGPKVTLSMLEQAVELPASAGGLAVCTMNGSCVVRRRMGKQWVDQSSIYKRGIVVASLESPLRIEGNAGAESVVVEIDAAQAVQWFAHLLECLEVAATLQLVADEVVDSLARALSMAKASDAGALMEQHMAEAILARVADISRACFVEARATGLANWRLRRVVTMIDERLGDVISLADMAKAAGLSAMHFAALFKEATGMRPRHYLQTQRVQRAKHLMKSSNVPLYDVALSTGFRTQAHFTTVFKQYEQVTPHKWRMDKLAA
jgi:AraC family transcriptional regulator